jgi:hypothetical protein
VLACEGRDRLAQDVPHHEVRNCSINALHSGAEGGSSMPTWPRAIRSFDLLDEPLGVFVA